MKAMLHTKGALMSIYRCYFHDNRGVTTDWKPVIATTKRKHDLPPSTFFVSTGTFKNWKCGESRLACFMSGENF